MAILTLQIYVLLTALMITRTRETGLNLPHTRWGKTRRKKRAKHRGHHTPTRPRRLHHRRGETKTPRKTKGGKRRSKTHPQKGGQKQRSHTKPVPPLRSQNPKEQKPRNTHLRIVINLKKGKSPHKEQEPSGKCTGKAAQTAENQPQEETKSTRRGATPKGRNNSPRHPQTHRTGSPACRNRRKPPRHPKGTHPRPDHKKLDKPHLQEKQAPTPKTAQNRQEGKIPQRWTKPASPRTERRTGSR